MGLGWKELLIVLVIVLADLRHQAPEEHRRRPRRRGEGFKKGVSGDDATTKPDADKPEGNLRDESRKD